MRDAFQGKVVLVTGGAYGIGRAAAIGFAARGAKVVVADIDASRGTETLQRIKSSGGEAIFVKTDVSSEEDVRILVDRVVETFGRLDCAFNNAGIHKRFVSTVDFTEGEWEEMIHVNLKSVWLCMKYEIPQMLKQGKGAIVNTSSVAGLVGAPSNPAYPASKHGVVGITKSTALEFARNKGLLGADQVQDLDDVAVGGHRPARGENHGQYGCTQHKAQDDNADGDRCP